MSRHLLEIIPLMQPARKSHLRPARFGSRLNTVPLTRLAAGGLLSLLTTLPLSATAQTAPSGAMPALPRPLFGSPAGGQSSLSLNISAESPPYHLDWNGTSGTLIRRALGGQPELRLPLTYLHSEPGPKGYSKYLAWFLARDKDHFSLVWCYLNDGGREFYCWLYQFPTNQLTTLRFVGDYRFAPLPEPIAPMSLPDLATQILPTYTGPDFKFRDWTRRSGKLETLEIQPARASYAASLSEEGQATGDSGQKTEAAQAPIANPQSPVANASKTLTGLRVYPLHEIQVAKGNGWRAGGWRELHAIALDSANDPYYLILYSNVTKGYVVDIKRGQTFVTDFGSRVAFSNDNTVFGAKEETIVGPPDARIRRYARTEIPLTTSNKYDNLYTNVQLYMEFRQPDGKTVSVPGFWDGGQTWRVRFTPTQIGKYSWHSYSNDTGLEKQVGSFTCVADDSNSKGFVTVNGQRFYPHSFASANGVAFFPVYLRDPVHYFPAPDVASTPASVPKTPASAKLPANVSLIVPMQDTKPGASLLDEPIDDPALMDLNAKNTPRTFTAFTRRVDDAAALGFNRFWGGWLLDPALFPKHAQENEGGAPFLNYNLDNINPAYFQWMDRRIAYCNERGIVPDIGITDIGSNLLTDVKPEQIRLLWQYVLARYAGFNVNWNLFGKSPDNPYPPDVDAWVQPLGKMTDLYDPVGHPVTTVVPNAAPQIPAAPSGPPVIIRPDNPVMIRPDTPNFGSGNFNPGNPNPGGFNPQGSNPAGSNPTGANPGGSNPPVLTPPPSRGVPGTDTPTNPGGTGDTGTPGNTGRRSRNQRGNAAGGDTAGANNTAGGRSATGNNSRGNTTVGSSSGRNRGAGQNGNGSANNTTRRGTDTSTPAGGASPQTPNFPGFPNAGSGFSNRSAMGGAGTGQDPTATDPRAQRRRGRTRGTGGTSGFGGFGGSGSSSGTYTGDTEITGNTTQNDYVTIVDPQVASAMRADRLAQHPTGAMMSVPIVRFASDRWLDVVTLAGGDIGALTIDYRLNKPLVVQDVTGKEPTDEARHRLWETIMRGGFWQGATTANTGVADPLNSQLARWQLAAARLMQKTQYTRLVPHQDMLGGLEETGFDRRRRKRSEAEAASMNAPANPTAPALPGGGVSAAPNAPTVPGRAAAPGGTFVPTPGGASGANVPALPVFTGDFDENGNPIFGPAPNMPAPQSADAAKKAAPGAIYVLADPGWEYVVYFTKGGLVTLDLLEATGTLRQSWYNPRTGEYASQDTMQGGIYKTFTAPDTTNDWVLLLSRR